MRTVSIREARKRLSELVEAAANGASVTITKRGREVARLGPAAQSCGRTLPGLAEFRASIHVEG
ncbi:type II toxin-antitoxin system prevent-host-death family antitoxin, partial [bacterium]|nr:type II toxin-antitoxin system prevent-host-death family antitoxin [bacterium]